MTENDGTERGTQWGAQRQGGEREREGDREKQGMGQKKKVVQRERMGNKEKGEVIERRDRESWGGKKENGTETESGRQGGGRDSRLQRGREGK